LQASLLELIITLGKPYHFATFKTDLLGASRDEALLFIKWTMEQNELNFLYHHEFMECSQLPSLPPIFSCAPCDEWRRRMHCLQYRQNCSLDRSLMSERYQCQRRKKGHGPICIHVTVNQSISSAPAPVEAAPIDPPPVDICTRRKSWRKS
jgi:hypothetical protein